MLKLTFECFGYLMQRADSLEKTMMLGKIEGKRRREWQRMRWLDSIMNSVDMNLSKLWETVKDRGDWHAAVHGVSKSQIGLSNGTTAKIHIQSKSILRELHMGKAVQRNPENKMMLIKTKFNKTRVLS